MRGIIAAREMRVHSRPQQAMITLSLSEVLEDRPFTHVQHNAGDAAHLERLRGALVRMLSRLTDNERGCQPRLELSEEDDRAMRHILARPRDLLDAPALSVVGFCGEKRASLGLREQEEMAIVDGQLVAELCEHPHMLSYSSIANGDGNWSNLVLMTHLDGTQHWRTSVRHAAAVESLAPRFYQHIRLHNGVLPDGLASERIVLTSTKYFDFSVNPPWRAIRHLTH
jgi:hypothetical protein